MSQRGETLTVEEIAPYISPAGIRIVKEIWNDSDDMAFYEDIAEVAGDTEIRALEEWDVINEGSAYSGTDADGNSYRKRRYYLSDNGYRLVENNFDEAFVPREEWTVEEWVEYPVPIEQKFAELVEEFIALSAEVRNEGG